MVSNIFSLTLNRSVLITGGCGFIGSHFVEMCHSLGMTIYILDNFSSGKNVFLPKSDRSAPVTYIIGDIRDPTVYSRLPSSIDFVIHLAAAISVAESINDPQKYMLTNVEGSRNVFQYAIKAGATAVLSASTAAYYGDCGTKKIDESFPYKGISPYAESKMKMEQLGAEFQRKSRCRFLFCRFFNVYGPRQDPSSPYTGVMSIFFDRCATNKPITIFGTGEQTRDFVFVKDLVVAGINLLVEFDKFPMGAAALRSSDPDYVRNNAYNGTGEYPNVFNIGSSVSVTINDLAELAKEVSSKDNLEVQHAEARTGDILHSLSDCSRIHKVIGWQAVTRLRAGMSSTWGWAAGEPTILCGDLEEADATNLKTIGYLCGGAVSRTADVDVKEVC